MLLVKPLKLRDFIAFSCFYFSVVTAIIFLCFSSLNNRDMITIIKFTLLKYPYLQTYIIIFRLVSEHYIPYS